MTAVPSRAEWFGEYPANGKIATVETHIVFGWKVQKHTLPVGSVLIVNSATTVLRAQTPNRAMYVQGRATVVNDGVSLDDRVPGLCTLERPDHPIGKTVVTAVEETVFWCFNYTMNRKSLPALTPIRIGTGGYVTLDEGAKVFVMTGTADSPCTFTAAENQVLTAESPLHAFIIAEAKV